VISTTGTLDQCSILKGLPHMDQAVLQSLASRRYEPVTYQGHPVPVKYVFNIRLMLRR
jgi:protein TonB